jgi:hypothetical protein
LWTRHSCDDVQELSYVCMHFRRPPTARQLLEKIELVWDLHK